MDDGGERRWKVGKGGGWWKKEGKVKEGGGRSRKMEKGGGR